MPRGRTRVSPAAKLIINATAFGFLCREAWSQLSADQVLVVYDSRIQDSLLVAEMYAGSASVPGGSGIEAGFRPQVRVFDLAASGAPQTTPGNISYSDFISRLRTPIRDHLIGRNVVGEIRCLVTTKGLPHRVLDTDNPNVGDFPNNFVTEFLASDATMASVDSELTLLWQDLSAGEAGGSADSRADGCILNPYWKSALPISSFSTANIQVPKSWLVIGSQGPVWSTTSTARLTAGDIYLVCRLDGRSLADIRSMLERSRAPLLDVGAASVLLDESDSNGITDTAANAEFDNSASAMSTLRAGDDYEQTRDLLMADGRFLPAAVRYNALAGVSNFFVGPQRTFLAGHGLLVTSPIVLLATYGANHNGVPLFSDSTSAATMFASSFLYSPGAVFNTIESYNGRDFGGLGQLSFAMQQQAADFIKDGGSFALCNVWEPLADSVPDNLYIAQNFLLGSLSWAEAAWSSTPALSWMQMAIGDPLTRITRSSEDVNGDGSLTIDDLHAWEQSPTDIDRSGSTNSTDRAILLRTLRFYEKRQMTK